MDDRDLRLRVSAHLQQLDEPSATLEEMEYALALGLHGDHWVTEDELAKTIAEQCRDWRHAPREAGQSPSPKPVGRRRHGLPVGDLPAAPRWWQEEIPQIWARHEEQQREMLTLFGLIDKNGKPSFLAIEAVASFVAEIASAERAEGDWLLLEVPLGFDLTPGTWEQEESDEVFALQTQARPVWRGFHRAPFIGDDGVLREPSATERAREQKLSRLAETAQAISDQIGSEPAAVVVYLLCGEWSGLPYVSVQRSPRYGGYVITVRDRRVPIKDVTAQYRVYRDLFSLPSRQPQEGPYLVEQFVTKAREEGKRPTWSQMFEQFERAYPRRYRSEASFRETFYSMQRKRQGK